MKWYKHIVFFLVMTVAAWSSVSLTIQNVDIGAGTLDIYMTNQAGCSYCDDPVYNNNSQDWTERKEYCELSASWFSYANITEEECANIPSIDENGGWWFNGEVGGFQFELIGVTIMGASGGSAEGMGFLTSTTSSTLLGFSLTGATIPAGEGILTQVTFTDFIGQDICFGEDTGSAGSNAIAGNQEVNGNIVSLYVAANWGDCYSTNIYGCTDIDACNYDSDANVDDGSCELPMENYDCDANCTADIDCAGECGGSAEQDECNICNGDGAIFECGCSDIADGACDCDGNVLDNCEVCGGNNSSCSGCMNNSICTYGNCACNYDASATIDNDSCNFPLENFDCDGECLLEEGCNDCFGIQNGTAEIDDCNTCIDCSQYEEDCIQHPAWNQSCTDCAEELNGNAFIDACGDCVAGTTGIPACLIDCEGGFGSGSFDNCEVCDDDFANDCEIDCNGNWGGTALIDNCGHCVDVNTGEEACVQDCNGDWGGTAWESDCGCVAGDNSGDDCDDCAGVPYGDNWESDCGCVADHDSGDDCDDCAGVPNGNNLEDMCGNCNDDFSNDCVQDCEGIWGGTAWESDCGCVANYDSGDDCDDCAGVPNGDNLEDNCGNCDDNSSNDCAQDCEGNWGGTTWESDCGCVAADNSGDDCDDCAGVPNGDNLEDNCGNCDDDPSNNCIPDCNGSWSGTSVDLGCGCDEPGPSGCDNECGSTLVYDECGVCGGDNTSCSWTNLTAEVQELNDIHLSWDPFVEETNSRLGREGRSECSLGACLSIENVDTGAGTLDIYMTNQAGCSYCTDPIWIDQNFCELYGNDGTGNASWDFDSNMDDNACTTVNGVYFDGNVGGFQFDLSGITITGASAPDGFEVSNTATSILAFSLTGATIPAGEGILTQVSFSDFEGGIICFAESDCSLDENSELVNPSACLNVISDAIAVSVSIVWGGCVCPVDLDECGVCGGNNVPMTGTCDCVGVPDGSAYLDHCDDCVGGNTGEVGCVGDCSTSEGLCDGNWLDGQCWGGTAYLDYCDECIGGGTGLEECAADCYGVINGGAVEDECGECEGPGGQVPCWCLGIENNYDNIDIGDCMACTNADCPLDPALSSYYVYRNGLGIPIAQVQSAEYIDEDLDYNEPYCYTATYIQVQDGTESGHSNVVCKMTDSIPSQDDAPELYGCMSSYACNYLIPGLECGTDDTPDCPIVDDGSCWFKAPGCDCDFDNDGQDDPGAVPDMCGVCGGSGYFDHCGTCDADSSNDCIQDCAGFWDGDLIGQGVYECVGVGDEENDPSDYNDEADCAAEGFFWLQIGNDLCDVCDGDDSSCEDDCDEPNGTCFESDCTFCTNDGTNPSEEFIDCNTENTICAGDSDWSSDLGNGSWNTGENYTDENKNGKYDEELCDTCADCMGNANGIASMEIVDEDWLDFWEVSEPQCCDSGDIDICGVCEGLGDIYECGCEGLPVDDDPASPTFGNQACSCDGNGVWDDTEEFTDANANGVWDDTEEFTDANVIEDDCGACGGSNYFMLINQNMDTTGEYCEEGDGWVVNNETDEIENCVLVDERDGVLTNYCDCAETLANECGLCIAEDTDEGSSEDQECCPIYEDCAGVCYGDAKVNPCGECWGGTLGECSLDWDNAADCEDELNGECTITYWDVESDGDYDSPSDTLNTADKCFQPDIGECLIDSNWAAQWDHDGIDTTDTIVILNEADCTIGECSVSEWDLNGDGEEEDVTNEADCLSIFECFGYTGTAAISSSSACTCLGYEWTQKGIWYNAEWFSSEWIVGEWTPFLENDLPECLEAECGSDEFECEDVGGEWYIGLCYGDAPKLGCDDICSNNPLEEDCNGDCGGPNNIDGNGYGDGTNMPQVNECGTCTVPDSDIDKTCIEGCDSNEDGETNWSDSGACKAGRCREAQCRAFDLEYLGDPIELIDILPNNLEEACQDTGGVWYGTYGVGLEMDNQDDCENCTDADDDGTCDNEVEVIGIWYPESGTTLDYDNKPDCEDIEQGGGTWVSFAFVEDDCGICEGTDHLGESGTFEDENSAFYGQCSCAGECFEERITLDCEGSCGGSAEIYFNDYGEDGLPATDELEADEGEDDGIEEEFCCESGNYDCTDVCDGPLANICIGNNTQTNKTACEDNDGYWSENGNDECGNCGESDIFVEGDPDILPNICEDTSGSLDYYTADECEDSGGTWSFQYPEIFQGIKQSSLNENGDCDCEGNKLDCDGVCAPGPIQGSDGCIEGGNGNYCSISDMDECGMCYGEDIFDSDGLLPNGSCDCFGNITNCAGECPTIPDPDNLSEWISNPDWEPISGVDVDVDGICDDVDDCVSNPLDNKHLFYKCDIAAINGICPVEDLSVVEEIDEEGKPNTNYGGYDICGICNGNGFSCGFEVKGGVEEMKLTWRKPFSDQIDSTLFDIDTTLSRTHGNTMGSFESYSLFSSSGGNTDNPPVSLDIKNVNIDGGTLDIVITSIPACSYCEDPLYNNNSDNDWTWVDKKQDCELYTEVSWVAFDPITEEECANIPSQTGNGGWWYDGHVGGFQFELSGIDITDATVPDDFIVNTGVTTNPDNEGVALLFGFSMTGATIPPGINILLTTISFTVAGDYAENGICFGEDAGSAGYNTISDRDGGYMVVDWGDCDCPEDNSVDICGVCGGDGYAEGKCDCEGNIDEGCGCGEDGPSTSTCWDNETPVCNLYECPADPDALNFNIYYEDAVGDLFLEKGGWKYNHYTQTGLDWVEAVTYAISYSYQGQEYFITDRLTYDDNQNPENAERILGVTDGEVLGCNYPSSCAYDNENPANTYLENSCWWPTYACDCESPQYSVVDECGVCDGGNADMDDCGVCNGGNEDDLGCGCGEAGPSGCDNACGSTAELDDCGVCDGGNADMDDCGVCEGDGTSCLSLYNGLIPDDYSIHNIYPNPFNPYANIVYGIPELSNVKVTVYDLHGRQIAVLQNDIQTPGYYAIQWDAAQYSSGVYFIEMLSDDFRQIKRVLHMK